MTHEEMLEQIIDKAIKNGYKGLSVPVIMEQAALFEAGSVNNFYVRGLLTSHSFAKSFFGEEMVNIHGVKVDKANGLTTAWQYFVKEAVLSKDIISYFYERL